MTKFLGTLASCSSLAVIIIGLPRQIRLNYQRQSCEGISKPLYFIVAWAYFIWMLYGLSINNMFIWLPQIPGFLLALIIIYQQFHYQKSQTTLAKGESQ